MELVLRGLKDHPDLQIHDAIVSAEWRHALQLIEKREKKLKKGQTNDWLTACKASILLTLPEPAKQRQGRTLLGALYARTPPVIDFNAVETIQSFAELRHELDPRIETLWMHSANAQPSDEELHRHWFKSCFRKRDWQGARKAAMTYTKHFPDKRDPFFWTIFVNFMASRTLPDQGTEKELCGTMAYRMYAKAAEATSLGQDQKGLRNGRVIRTLDDISFLLDVYRSQGKYEEAIAVLESDHTGINSRIGRRSWKLVAWKIRLLGLAQRWLDQYKFCFELLEDASPVGGKPQVHGFGKMGNDGCVWTALVNSALSLQLPTWMVHRKAIHAESSETTVRKAIEENFYKNTRLAVASLLDTFKMDRNAMCAGMLWVRSLDTDVRKETLATKAFEYFEAYGHKTFCFNDLQPHVSAMKLSGIQHFLDKVRAWLMELGYGVNQLGQDKIQSFNPHTLMAKTNALKLEYCLIHSRDMKSNEIIQDTSMETFIDECIQCYQFGLKNSGNDAEKPREFAERFPGDDAGLLATAALLKCPRNGRNGKMLQAIILIDELSTRSPASYEALGTLILFYIRLGAGLLAARAYHKLSIKNIQLPTLSWLLWTRLSTVHPHNINPKDLNLPNNSQLSKADFDPVHHLTQALDYHIHLQDTDQHEILEFLEAKQYASLHRAMSNSLHNQNGFVKYLLVTEWARTERLSGLQQQRDYWVLFDQPSTMFENRDESSVPCWEHPDSRPLLLDVMPGEWPTVAGNLAVQNEWLSRQMSIARTFSHVMKRNGSAQRSDVYRDRIAYAEPETSMTREEHTQYQTAVECQSMLNLYGSKVSEGLAKVNASWSVLINLESIEKRQEAVNKELATMRDRKDDYFWVISDEVIAPSWQFFHAAYTSLDTAILIKKALDIVETGNSKARVVDPQQAAEKVAAIRKLCDELGTIIHAEALNLYQALSSETHHNAMVNSIVGRPSDTQENDPIAYRLRKHFDRGSDGADKVVKAFITELCQAWCEALQNLCKLTAPP
ncbi:MAG: hypothetical protein Q9213_000932 [Squamulea squamosa]